MVSDLAAWILRSYRGGLCVACDVPADQVDHFKPRHAGGTDIPENLLPLCALCNKTKSCMWPGHGYHPLTGYDHPLAATAILVRELDYLTGIYGESRLLELLGEELAEFNIRQLDLRGKQRDANRATYLHLAEALQAELGDRAYRAWYHAGRGRYACWYTRSIGMRGQCLDAPGGCSAQQCTLRDLWSSPVEVQP